jgi:hypothetical protein
MLERIYPEKTLILDFRGDWEGDTFYQKNPHLGVYIDYATDPQYAGLDYGPGAQHGNSTTLYSDKPGARLWWFVEDYYGEIKGVRIYE